MAVTNADILGWLNANPGADAALINQTMAEAGVSAAQYQSATGAPPPPVAQAVAPQGMLSGPAPSAPAPAPAPTVSNADILGWFNANPNASDALIAKTMQEAGVSPVRLAQVTGAPVDQVIGLFQQAISSAQPAPKTITDLYQQELGRLPESQAVVDEWKRIFGDTIEPNEVETFKQATQLEKTNPAVANIKGQILAQGTTDKWTGEGKGSAEANATDMANILAGIGITDISQFGQLPDGSFGNKLTGQAVPNTYSERQTGNAFGGTFAGKGNTGYRVNFDAQGNPLFYTTSASSSDVPKWVVPALAIGAAVYGLDVAGLLAGDSAALSALDAGLGVYGTGATVGGIAGGLSALDAGMGVYGTGGTVGGLAGGLSALDAGMGVYDATNFGNVAGGLSALDAGMGVYPSTGNIGLSALDAGLGAYGTGAGLLTNIGGSASTVLPSSLVNAGVSTAVNKIIGGGGTPNIPNLISGGLGTAGNLLQMQESREAAQRAQARIDAETAAAKASAAFRPIGTTTRFGTSQFQVDPVTGQLTSAGYTLSPEAKAQQDRFMALSNVGLTQAEQAPTQFAPLKTGAERLFGLGNQYLAQTPEQVAQNYLAQQMNLLAPSREIELANLQTRLRNQGRIGLSVAQGGDYGATTPELQALYNARARQEAELAAQAQLAGQRDVLFGANLLDQGSRTMGQYYSGQTGSYAPYTTAMGQVQSLEALGQQPFNMSNALAQQTSTAGARVGQLGLQGAGQSVALATGADATRNLGAQSLIAAGNPNAQFGQAIGGALGGLFNTAPATSGFSYGQYGTGIDPSTGEYFGSLYF